MIAAMRQESIVFVMVLLRGTAIFGFNGRKLTVRPDLFDTIFIGTSYQSTQENHIEGTELYYRLYHSVYLAHTEIDAPRICRKYCSRQFSEVGQIAHGLSV